MQDHTQTAVPEDANAEINRKLRQMFDGRIVRKDLTKKSKRGPMYLSMSWNFCWGSIAVRMTLM